MYSAAKLATLVPNVSTITETTNQIADRVTQNFSASTQAFSSTLKSLAPRQGNSKYFQTDANMEEIKKFLDPSSPDKDKLEAMKRLIAMISQGRDASVVFPDVVKNVIRTNFEVKKLVYLFLTHYAELEPEASLLAINSFTKDLDNKNQIIRAQALRVMTSIRVPMIVQIMILSIKKASTDSSPYVRKAAAHAVPKVLSLDPDQREQLVEIVSLLLRDTSTLVLGSVIAAFCEVCPNRFDLLHPHFRKLCQLLADIDEWGQIIILNTLTRYARTQFVDPNKKSTKPAKTPKKPQPKKKKKKSDDSDSDDSDSDDDSDDDDSFDEDFGVELSPDHLLLLKASQPLLQSRNHGVVLAVSSLFFYCGRADDECPKAARALIRISRNRPEYQYVILSNIASIATSKKSLFSGFISEFYVKVTDPHYIRLLKLEIMTTLASDSNVSNILKEFNIYIQYEEKDFVKATIDCIGRVAAIVSDVTSTCMSGLMKLITHKSEEVVAQSVIVLRRLIQLSSSEKRENKKVLIELTKTLPKITNGDARASILWIVGEYSDSIPEHSPDVLRTVAKSFVNEADITKLQVLNLGAKLCIRNPEQTSLIFHYILNLAKYDQVYDIRDRARMYRKILFVHSNSDELRTGESEDQQPQQLVGDFGMQGGAQNVKVKSLSSRVRALILAPKPPPSQTSVFQDRQRFVLGSLAHMVNHTTLGYQTIPEWPLEAPDPSVREVKIWQTISNPTPSTSTAKKSLLDDDSDFWSSDEDDDDDDDDSEEDDDDEDDEDEDEDDEDDDEDEDESEEESDEDDSDEDDSDEDSEDERKKKQKQKQKQAQQKQAQQKQAAQQKPAVQQKQQQKTGKNQKSDPIATLLDFDLDMPSSQKTTPAPAATTDIGALFGLGSPTAAVTGDSANSGAGQYTQTEAKKGVLLKGVIGGGLQIDYTILRRTSMYGPRFSTLLLTMKNTNSNKPVTDVTVVYKGDEGGAEMKAFNPVSLIGPGQGVEQPLSIAFKSLTKPVKLDVCHSNSSYSVTLAPNVGELIFPAPVSVDQFKSEAAKLVGGFETNSQLMFSDSTTTTKELIQKVIDEANFSFVGNEKLTNEKKKKKEMLRFSGRTTMDEKLVLFSIVIDRVGGDEEEDEVSGSCKIQSENTMLSSMLQARLKKVLTS